MQPVSTRSDLARVQHALHQRPARVEEDQAVPLQALHDEALAAEQARPDPLLEGDADGDALGTGQERVLLRDQLAAELRRGRTGTIFPG